ARVGFFPRGDRYVGRVYAYLAIYDSAGSLVSLHRSAEDLSFAAETKDLALAGEVKIGLRFGLARKGDYTVVVTLRDELTHELGTADAHWRFWAGPPVRRRPRAFAAAARADAARARRRPPPRPGISGGRGAARSPPCLRRATWRRR